MIKFDYCFGLGQHWFGQLDRQQWLFGKSPIPLPDRWQLKRGHNHRKYRP